jgi:hypothetical protein
LRSSTAASVFAALALVNGAAPALAADAEPKFNIMGPATCADWPKSGAISSAAKAVPLNWTLGFLSGWAALGNLKLLGVIDAEEVSKWMGDYCLAHPTVSLPLAARELERELEAKLPPPPPPPEPPQPIVMPPPPQGQKPAAPAAKPKPRPARRGAARQAK